MMLILIIPLLVMAGMAAAGGGLGGVLSRRSGAEKRQAALMQQAQGNEYTRSQGLDAQAAGSRGQYMDFLNNYDPQQYAETAAHSLGETAYQDFAEGDAARGRDLARRGFVGAGVGSGRQKMMYGRNLSRDVAGLAMQSSGMQLQKAGMYGNLYGADRGYADESHTNYLDLLAGNRDYETGVRNDRTNAVLGGVGAGVRAFAASKYGR